jgi:hypothetical protein
VLRQGKNKYMGVRLNRVSVYFTGLLKTLLISKQHERSTLMLPKMASKSKAFTANIQFFSIPPAIMVVYHIMSGKQKLFVPYSNNSYFTRNENYVKLPQHMYHKNMMKPCFLQCLKNSSNNITHKTIFFNLGRNGTVIYGQKITC